MISTVRKIPPVLLIIFCTLCQSVSGQAGGVDRDSLLRENRLLREQLEHLQARREAFRWRRFPDGPLLRSGTVMQIAPGPGSRLAFATDSQGLVLFDGTWLEVYDSENSSLPDNFVTATALFGDKLWIGTAAGLAVLDADGSIHRPAPLPGELAGGTVSCLLAAGDSSLWVGTQGAGLWRFDGERWQQFTSPDTAAAGPGDINALAPSAPGDGVWAATAGEGIWRVTGGALKCFGQPLGPGSEEIYSVITDSDALVWIGAAGAGAGFWDGFGWQRAPLPVSGGAGVICIAELTGGDLFFGTTEGAWFYVRQGNSWEKLPLPEEIAAAPIVAAAGRNGRLWLAPSGSGVYFHDRGLATRFAAASDLPSESVYQINQSADGRIWFSTFGGVAIYDGRRWSRLDRRNGLPDNLVTFTLFGPGDTVAFATHRGAGILSGGRWKYLNRDLGLRSNTINHLALDSRDGLWLSTEGGGLTLSYKDSLLTYTTAEGLPANQVQAALPAVGDSVWVATKRGLALITGGMVLGPAADNATDEPGPPAVHYTALAMDSRGALWAASAGDGAWRRDAAGHWEKFGVENGLGSNEVYAVATHSDGRLFFGTRAGLSIFDGLSWRNLSGKDGLNPGAVRSVFVDSGGALWLSGDRNGVLRFDTGRLKLPETYLETPSGVLCALGPAGEPLRLARADSSGEGRLMLGNSRYAALAGPAGADTVRSNRINLSVHAVTPWWNTPRSDFTFQWRLDNDPWSSHLAGGHLTVFDLSRGSHVLEVRARDPYLRLDPTPASYSFYVDIPTLLGDWRFWAATFVLVGGALGLWQRRRLQWWLSIVRHRRFRPVTPNPFNPNAPQSEQERFRGRDELLERLAGLFDGKDHGSVIIHGGERIGMTSFLLQCRNLAGHTGAQTVYLDLAAEAFTGVDRLATRLAAKIAHDETAAEHGKNNPLDTLAALLETGTEPMVLIFDNAELLGRLLQRDSEQGKRLVALFRAAVLKDRAAAFVFGTAELDSFREGAKTLFEMSRLYRLGPVNMDEAAAILAHPLQGRAVIHARALEMLATLSGGQPYLLQWLGRELVEVINAGQSSLVTLELAGRAVARLVADPPLPLLDSWEELPRREKLVLAAMYKIRAEGDGGSMAVGDIRAVLAGHGIEMLAEELAKAAADLSERNLVKLDTPSAALTAPDTLLGRWIASATSIPAIAARQEYDIGEALHRFSDELSRSFRLDELAGRVLSFFESILHPEYSAFLTARPADNDGEEPLLVLESVGGSGTVANLPEKIPAAALERLSLIVEKTTESAAETSGFPAGCVLAPLLARGEPVGLVVLGPRRDGERYNSRDRMLLETCAEQTAVAMENSRLYEEETEKERLKQELDTARRMQMAILPERKPDIPGLDFCAYLSPATEVGGDYYDYKLLDSGQLVFVIGDVSGHGVSAGTLVTMSKSCIFNQLRTSHAVEQVMSAMNEMVYGALAEKLLMTLCYAIIDPAAGKLVYSIAGHPFPYHVHAADGTLSELDISAYPLGVTRKARFRTAEVNFAPGDSFVFFSDGIVEAQNPENEQWGFERFEQVVTGNAGLDAESLTGKILSEFDDFRRGVPQDDDVTLVTIKVR